MQALSAVLGGAQSLHTNGYDEAFAIPTEDAMKMALRTQQIIAEETNVTNVVDPLGGVYYVEALTTEYEKRIFDILEARSTPRGGTIKADRAGLVPEADRRLRLRNRAAQAVRRASR